MTLKRRRAPTDPLELANRKTDEEFVADYLRPGSHDSPWTTRWTHPRTGLEYALALVRAGRLADDELAACLALVEQTSRADYERSSWRWRPDRKRAEMRSPALRYILVREARTRAIRAFTSLMPTYEQGEPVIYCYEIHLQPELRGTGLGALLMRCHATVAANLPPAAKVMLTCFRSNQRGLAFYRKMGFETDPISPGPRRLRRGKVVTPDYVILSRPVRSNSSGTGTGTGSGSAGEGDAAASVAAGDAASDAAAAGGSA